MKQYFFKKSDKPIKFGEVLTFTSETKTPTGSFEETHSILFNEHSLQSLLDRQLIYSKEIKPESLEKRVKYLEDRVSKLESLLNDSNIKFITEDLDKKLESLLKSFRLL